MPRRRDPSRPDDPDTPPDQGAVERAIRAIVERLKPKPAGERQGSRPEPPPGRKTRRVAAPPA